MPVMIAASLTSSDWAIVLGIVVAWVVSALLVRRSPQLGAMVASGLGVGASVYLIQQKYSDTSVCSGEQTGVFDCDAVNQSDFSALGPVPVATLGAAFFLAVLFVSWRAGSKAEEHPGYPGFLLAAGLSSCLASLTMGFISFVKLGAVCPFCVSLYGLSAILLWAGWRASGERLPGEGLMKRLSLMGGGPSLGSGVVAFLVSVVVLYIGFTPDDDVVKAGDVLTNVDLVGDEPSKGNPDAAYVVMEFADFQCPGCAHLHPEMDELIRGNDDIRLIFKHLPLEMHEYAFLAAKGAVCAHQQDKFWDMSDLIFSNQKTLNKQSSEFAVRELLKFWAGPKQLGLDLPAFSACLSAEATSDRVNADIAAAETMEIKGTPAVFLEGVCGPGQWVRIDNRIPGVLAAIEAHKTGATLPFSCAPAAEETDAETDADPALSSSSTAPQE